MSENKSSNDEMQLAENEAVYVMSVAAELVDIHPQTLREYERKGLLKPQRSKGGNRRYTSQDLQRIMRIKKMRQEGMSITAIAQLMEYEQAMLHLKQENDCLKNELEHTQERLGNVEERLYHVESQLDGKALVKLENQDIILSVQNEKIIEIKNN